VQIYYSEYILCLQIVVNSLGIIRHSFFEKFSRNQVSIIENKLFGQYDELWVSGKILTQLKSTNSQEFKNFRRNLLCNGKN
jgi:hypothetical protein